MDCYMDIVGAGAGGLSHYSADRRLAHCPVHSYTFIDCYSDIHLAHAYCYTNSNIYIHTFSHIHPGTAWL